MDANDPKVQALWDLVKQKIQDLIDAYKKAASDGRVEFAEAYQLVSQMVFSTVTVLGQFSQFDGPTKKAVALQAVGLFYDTVVAPLDIPLLPDFIERTVDASLRRFALGLADGLIEAVVSFFGKFGWPGSPTPTPTPAPGPAPTPTVPTTPSEFIPY